MASSKLGASEEVRVPLLDVHSAVGCQEVHDGEFLLGGCGLNQQSFGT